MGPSGSGKSTLLAALSGLMRPEAGQVLALGKDLWARSRKEQEAFRLRHFGFVFQGYNLFPALTARQQLEIILLWGHGASGREARQRADDTLARLGLAGKGHLRPAQLSGGEKQRVAIGRALVKDPDFCFADEPTNALDWSRGEQVVQMLREAARERRATVLVVTHDARLVPYADRVFHLDDGRLSEPDEDALSARHAPREGHPYSENAVEEYTRALRRDRRNAELYRKRALAYAAWEKAERALADLNRAESASAGEGWLTLSPVP